MNILHIDSSLFGQQGVSSQLAEQLLQRFSRHQPRITSRRFADQPLPYVDGVHISALMTPATDRSPEQQRLVDLSDQLIAEVQDADVLVIGVPMYNFSVPAMLKSWFDHIARAGVTFRYTANGPEGLLKGKRAYLLASRGGLHQGQPSDSQTALLTTFLNFIGITDIHWIYAEGLNMGEYARSNALAAAGNAINALAI